MKQELNNKQLKRIQAHLKLKHPFFEIGKGGFGIAYMTKDKKDRVYKITSDENEVFISKRYGTNNEYFAKTYKIYKLKSVELSENTWLIIKEYITPLNDIEKMIYRIVQGETEFIVRKRMPESYVDMFLKQEELSKNVTSDIIDLSAKNVGWRNNNKDKLVAFDYTSIGLGKPIHDLEINLD